VILLVAVSVIQAGIRPILSRLERIEQVLEQRPGKPWGPVGS